MYVHVYSDIFFYCEEQANFIVTNSVFAQYKKTKLIYFCMNSNLIFQVRRDELSHVAREDLCRINNSLDCQCSPLPPSVIVERALMKVRKNFLVFECCRYCLQKFLNVTWHLNVPKRHLQLGTGDYNLLFNNCEHFVKYCRYGEPESDQVSFKAHLVTFKITR